MMQLSLPAPTRCSSIQHRGSMHKFMGLHHYNLLATAPNRSSSPTGASGAHVSRSSSGPLMPHSSSSSNSMLTYAVRGGMGPNSLVTLRCLPVEDDGLLQLSGTNPGDAIMGDVDTEPRAGMGQEQQGREGRSQAAGESSVAHALKASIPKGPLAEDAAMCDPCLENHLATSQIRSSLQCAKAGRTLTPTSALAVVFLQAAWQREMR